MSLLERQLRASIALVRFRKAIEELLPLALNEHRSLAAAAAISHGYSTTQQSADEWLEAVMDIELALKALKALKPGVLCRRGGALLVLPGGRR